MVGNKIFGDEDSTLYTELEIVTCAYLKLYT